MKSSTIALFAAVSMLGGCKKFELGKLKEYLPKLSFNKMKVSDVDFQGLQSDFMFDIDNPYPIGLKVAGFEYHLDLEDQPFLDSASEMGLDIGAGGVSTASVPAAIKFKDVFALGSALRGKDDMNFDLVGKFKVDTPAGPIDLPFDHTGVMPTLRAPQIKPAAVRVGKVNLLQQTATVEVDLGVTNTAAKHTYGFDDFVYGIDLGGARVVDGQLEPLSLEGGTSDTVTIPITVNLLQLGSTVVSSITKKRPMDIHLAGGLAVATPLGGIPLSIDETVALSPK